MNQIRQRRKAAGRPIDPNTVDQTTGEIIEPLNNPENIVGNTPIEDVLEPKVDEIPAENTIEALKNMPEDDPLTAPLPQENTQETKDIAPAPAPAPDEYAVTERPPFQLNIAHGWAFWRVGRQNMHVFTGHLRLTEQNANGKQIIARLLADQHKYEVTIREFGDKGWKELVTFEMPQLGNQRYVETWVTLPSACFDGEKQDIRAKVRAWKGKQTFDGRASLRIMFPDLAKDSPTTVAVPM